MDIDALEPFPDDDRTWWIRWVDRYSLPGGATSTRHATVLLSRFPNRLEGHDLRTIDVAELIAEDTPTVRAIVPAGAIPRLVIGAVFRLSLIHI